jgi:hypothetical protein
VRGLPDVALADAKQGVVFYDPEQLRAIGSDMAAFVMAHEEAHVRLGHTPPASESDSVAARALELQADCEAAATLAGTGRWSMERVLRVFERIGDGRADADHLTGTQRAETIRACGLARGGAGKSIARAVGTRLTGGLRRADG